MMNKNFTRLTAILLFVAGATSTVSAQYLKVGTDPFGLNSSAALQIDTYTAPITGFPNKKARGFLLPRTTTDAITSPIAEGLVIYDTSKDALMVYSGSPLAWKGTSAIGVTKYRKVVGSTTVSSTSLADDDYTILGDATNGSLTLNLPVPTNVTPTNSTNTKGRILIVGKSDSSTNTVTFSPPLKLFVGTTTTNVASLDYPKTFRIQSNGTDWYIIGF